MVVPNAVASDRSVRATGDSCLFPYAYNPHASWLRKAVANAKARQDISTTGSIRMAASGLIPLEAIAHATHGENVLGMAGVVFKLLPQIAYVHVNGSAFTKKV